MKESQLNLVDLAGSERQKDTNAVGQRLKVPKQYEGYVLYCDKCHKSILLTNKKKTSIDVTMYVYRLACESARKHI